MDWAFLIVVAVGLGLASMLIAARLIVSGAPAWRLAAIIGEVWLAFALWIVVFASLAAAAGLEAGQGGLAGLRIAGARLAALPALLKAKAIAGGVISLGLFVHGLVWLSRTRPRY
jgi:hypothetical protein